MLSLVAMKGTVWCVVCITDGILGQPMGQSLPQKGLVRMLLTWIWQSRLLQRGREMLALTS